MNKICTDISQSQKLLELGIDINTADMFYPNAPSPVPCVDDGNPKGDVYIPAWSLASLLSIIPKHIGDSIFRMDMGETDIALWFDDLSYGTVDEILPDIIKENFVDAAFEMVCWLKENGRI